MIILGLSLLAGILTVLAPCVLPLLPIIIGGSVGTSKWQRPTIIISSLVISIVLFTLLLKVGSSVIGLSQDFWKTISAMILIGFGILIIFPLLWTNISTKLGFEKSNELIQKSKSKGGVFGDILLGASLGPVFTSCSPTFAVILAIVLPASFVFGVINLLVYSLGLGIMLLLISFLGQKITSKLKVFADPNGIFKKSIGVIIILTGITIVTGFDKTIEAWMLEKGYGDFTEFEVNLLEKNNIY